MKNQIASDLTFRFAHTGDMIIARNLTMLCQLCHRLFHAIPDRDIYNKDGYGLDIMTRSRRVFPANAASRDFEYENMIMEQFRKFTDIKPLNVIVYYKNETLTVLMDAQYGDLSFQLRVSSDPKLATEIKPKAIRGI